MRTRLAIPLALALTALACQTKPKPLHRLAQDQPSTPGSIREVDELKAAPAPHQPGLTGSGTVDKPFARPVETQNQGLPGDFPSAPSTMVIRSGTASIRIDSLEPALATLRVLAARVGGYVANTSVQAGPAQYRQATLEIKVPAARFDDLISGLEPIGKVEAVNVTAEDVGEEFVDVSARVTNARRLESRLIELLATRTGRLQDVLSVERELARVREEIERYEGRLRYLQTHAATSSLSITVHEPFPVVGRPGSNVLVRAMERAWRNFVELVAAFIASLGVLVPVVLAGGTIVWGVRRWRRPREA
jgi:uncharacterized protein DUF4349